MQLIAAYVSLFTWFSLMWWCRQSYSESATRLYAPAIENDGKFHPVVITKRSLGERLISTSTLNETNQTFTLYLHTSFQCKTCRSVHIYTEMSQTCRVVNLVTSHAKPSQHQLWTITELPSKERFRIIYTATSHFVDLTTTTICLTNTEEKYILVTISYVSHKIYRHTRTCSKPWKDMCTTWNVLRYR